MAKKMKLIDQQAAINAVDVGNLHRGIVDALQSIISELPTIDAVKIVRCKACAHWSAEYTGNIGYCDVWDQYINDGEFFCACGCRRLNNGK